MRKAGFFLAVAVCVAAMTTTAFPEVAFPVAVDPEDRARLHRTWEQTSGFWGWLTSVNHKSVAKRYIATALIWFALGGIEAATIRLQLSS